jgi:hypothetical protein
MKSFREWWPLEILCPKGISCTNKPEKHHIYPIWKYTKYHIILRTLRGPTVRRKIQQNE